MKNEKLVEALMLAPRRIGQIDKAALKAVVENIIMLCEKYIQAGMGATPSNAVVAAIMVQSNLTNAVNPEQIQTLRNIVMASRDSWWTLWPHDEVGQEIHEAIRPPSW